MASVSLSLVVQLTADKHCFVSLPQTAFAPHLAVLAHGPAVLQLDWTPPPTPTASSPTNPSTSSSSNAPVRAYVGWAGALLPATAPNTLALPSALATCLNLPPSHLVRTTLLQPPPPPPTPSVTLSPLTSDDWELTSLLSSQLERHLLEQLQVVTLGAVIPFWVEGGGACVRLRVEEGKAGGAAKGGYVRLGLQTEVVVVPQVRGERSGAGKEDTGVKVERPRKYKLRVQRCDEHQPTEEHKEEKEDTQPLSVAASSAGRCVYVNERTLRGMRLKDDDIVVLTSSTVPAATGTTTSTTSICRIQVSSSALPLHILVPPALVYRHRIRFHQPVHIAAVHPQLAALSTKHIRSLHIQPLSIAPSQVSAQRLPSTPTLPTPSATALSTAMLSAVHAHKQRPLTVEAEGSVLELQVDGQRHWVQLTVNADNKQRTATATTDNKDRPEQKRKEDEDRQPSPPPVTHPKLSVSLSTPLTYFLLTDPQQLQPSVASSKLPPLPLPLPVVQPAATAAGTVGFSAAPVAPSHTLNEIGGMSSFISLCLSHLLSFYPQLPTSPSQPASSLPSAAGLMLSGPPSSAKSLVAAALVHHLYLTHSIHPVVLVQQPRERPEDAVRRCLREACQYAPSLLVVDDIDALLPAATGDESSWESVASAAVVCELLEAAIQGGGVAVLAVTSSATAHHARLCSTLLFPCVMEMPVLGVEERADVIEQVMAKRGVTAVGGREMRRRLSERMDGYKGRDVSQVVTRAIHAALSRRTHSAQQQPESSEQLRLTTADFNNALLGFVPVSLAKLAPVSTSVDWDDIGGLFDVKQTLVDTLQLPTQYAPLFDALPIKLRSGVLLYGAPGCGKTALATAVAAHSGLHLLAVKGPELLNKYIGSSEQAVRAVFEQARAAAPCLLFFDEMEAIATKRGGESTGVTDRVVNQFLCELDGVEGGAAGGGGRSGRVYVLAASSRPDLLDAALLRPGRIDKSLYVGFPTAEERADILRRLLLRDSGGQQLDDEWSECVQRIAAEADGYSGADLNGLLTDAQTALMSDYVAQVREAKENSEADGVGGTVATELTAERLLAAFRASHASVSERERKDFERLYARFITAKEGNTSEQFDPNAKLRTTQA